MVTSNKAGVGSLTPFLPLRFLSLPLPLRPLGPGGPALAAWGSGDCVSPLASDLQSRDCDGAGRLGDGCGRPGLQGLRAALPGPVVVACFWPQRRLGQPIIDCYDLVTSVFVLGMVITCAS